MTDWTVNNPLLYFVIMFFTDRLSANKDPGLVKGECEGSQCLSQICVRESKCSTLFELRATLCILLCINLL